MKRCFCDLHLRVNPKDAQATHCMLEKAACLGYRKVSIAFSNEFDEAHSVALKASAKDLGLDFVLRADYKPRNQEDLMHFLRRYRRKLEVICIFCDNKNLARQAAKDRRVDLIHFTSFDYRKRFFDRAEAELASSNLASLEVDVKPLLVLEGPPRVRMLACLRREVSIAREFHVPVVVSSGASELALMRMPRDLASLGYLFGLGEGEALDAISTNPSVIVERNRKKLDPKFVAPGITIVKEAGP